MGIKSMMDIRPRAGLKQNNHNKMEKKTMINI